MAYYWNEILILFIYIKNRRVLELMQGGSGRLSCIKQKLLKYASVSVYLKK